MIHFVLLAADGKYYYSPNLGRSVKVIYEGKDIKVTGKMKGKSIAVDKFEIKEAGKYKLI